MAASESVAAPRRLWVEIAGWAGPAAILGAYALSSFGVLAQGMLYQLLNATGALGVAVVCLRRRAWPAFVLEAAWATIATISLLRLALA